MAHLVLCYLERVILDEESLEEDELPIEFGWNQIKTWTLWLIANYKTLSMCRELKWDLSPSTIFYSSLDQRRKPKNLMNDWRLPMQ